MDACNWGLHPRGQSRHSIHTTDREFTNSLRPPANRPRKIIHIVLEIQTHNRFKRVIFIITKHNMRIFGVSLFFQVTKQQLNDVKWDVGYLSAVSVFSSAFGWVLFAMLFWRPVFGRMFKSVEESSKNSSCPSDPATVIKDKQKQQQHLSMIIIHNLKQNEAQSFCTESTNKGVNLRSKDDTQTQQQRPESPTVTLIWLASKYKEHKLHQRYIPWIQTCGIIIGYWIVPDTQIQRMLCNT